MEIGSIFSWADNYDLYSARPNGIKATHAVVMSSPCTPPASSRHGTLTDAADYPSTEETLVILSATDPPGYTVGALYGAFKAEPISASDEGPVRQRVAASVRCSQI